jgi:hypothetical protein
MGGGVEALAQSGHQSRVGEPRGRRAAQQITGNRAPHHYKSTPE